MDLLIQEFNSVKERNFQLEFTYPDKSQRKNMRIIHRDMTQNELRDIRKSNSNLADITSKLANGEIRKEDLDEDTVNRLKDTCNPRFDGNSGSVMQFIFLQFIL